MIKACSVLFLLVLLLNPWTQSWIASGFVVDDGLQPSDVVVALRSGPEEQSTRTDEAAKLLAQGYAKTILVDAFSEPYFGTTEARVVEAYLKSKGIPERQIQLCENDADSTRAEARALRRCFERIGARQAIVVTSEYHTRRARFLLRRELAGSGVTVRIHPVFIPFYWNTHWWRSRRWAKTFFDEAVKSVWTVIEDGIAALREHWKGPETKALATPGGRNPFGCPGVAVAV